MVLRVPVMVLGFVEKQGEQRFYSSLPFYCILTERQASWTYDAQRCIVCISYTGDLAQTARLPYCIQCCHAIIEFTVRMGSKESSILTLAMIPCSHWESWFSNFSILYSHIESFPTSGSQGVPHFRRDMRGCNTQPYLIISSRALSSLFVPLLVNPKPSTSTAHSCCPWWNKAQHHSHVSRLSSHKSFKQTHTLSRRPRG